MSDDGFSLYRLVKEYRGPKLKMMLAGAGSYCLRVLEVPGASKVLDSIYVPYSEERMNEWIWKSHPSLDSSPSWKKYPKVSREMADIMHVCNCTDLGVNMPITVTASITSSTQRRGENQAYIVTGPPNNYDMWFMKLSKLDDEDFTDRNKVESRRFIQDRMISEVALSLATGIPSALLDEMQDGEYLTKVE